MAESLEQMPKSETIRLRERHIGQACKLFYKSNPLKIVRAEGQYMYDERGNRYLDCINNVAHVGHCHPAVVRAGQEQMALVSTNNRFLHDDLVICARRLTSQLPEPLSVCFLVNSGSEANDLALRLAQTHTGNKDPLRMSSSLVRKKNDKERWKIVEEELLADEPRRKVLVPKNEISSFWNTEGSAYHGHLTSMIDISPYKFNKPNGPGKKDWIHVAPCPDVYRGKYRETDYPGEDLGVKYANDVRDICQNLESQGKGVCAYIAESLMSVGGQILPPQNYFRNVYRHVREHGGICIADEVQVGFGRVGSHMWAFQMFGEDVVPDIVTVGKPMGNGHPVAAVITTPAIAASFRDTGIEYFNTYGGNPVSCAIANAVMEVLERENLQENALKVGNYLMSELRKLAKRWTIIGDVRGAGLFAGIELVRDRIARTPATEEARHVVSRMRENKILISSDGPDDNILKLKPPMVFSIENVNHLLTVLEEVLQEVDIELQQKYKPVTIIKATISQMDVDTDSSNRTAGKPLLVRAN